MQVTLSARMSTRPGLALHYAARVTPEAWVIPEGTVPESTAHDAAALRIFSLLKEWAKQQPGRVRIARNLAIRWFPEYPRSGIDPDVCVLDPAPEEMDRDLTSLCLWKPGHCAPRFCVEVVSANHPHKDYVDIADRYASLGVPELFVFDPLLQGPAKLGGPCALQLWRRDPQGILTRVHAGDDPVFSEELAAWLSFRDGQVVVSEDRAAARPWLTEVERERLHKEHERAEKEHERAEKERERAARLELERRLAELTGK